MTTLGDFGRARRPMKRLTIGQRDVCKTVLGLPNILCYRSFQILTVPGGYSMLRRVIDIRHPFLAAAVIGQIIFPRLVGLSEYVVRGMHRISSTNHYRVYILRANRAKRVQGTCATRRDHGEYFH